MFEEGGSSHRVYNEVSVQALRHQNYCKSCLLSLSLRFSEDFH